MYGCARCRAPDASITRGRHAGSRATVWVGRRQDGAGALPRAGARGWVREGTLLPTGWRQAAAAAAAAEAAVVETVAQAVAGSGDGGDGSC